jgi:1-acyl-sn-glycerol-3-phosphate acyltransferase
MTQQPPRLPPPRTVAALRRVLDIAYAALTRREAHGLEQLPASGGFLLVFNHLTNYDPHLIFTLVRRPRAVGLVAADYRVRPFHRFLVERTGGLWLRRGAADRRALEVALNLLASGWMVGLAPEGRRSPTGTLQPGRPGAAFLALRSGAPIVPVGVAGTERIGHPSWLRVPVIIRFGEPFFLPRQAGRITRAQLQEATTTIMSRIAALLPERYRGVYAEDPEQTAPTPCRERDGGVLSAPLHRSEGA